MKVINFQIEIDSDTIYENNEINFNYLRTKS